MRHIAPVRPLAREGERPEERARAPNQQVLHLAVQLLAKVVAQVDRGQRRIHHAPAIDVHLAVTHNVRGQIPQRNQRFVGVQRDLDHVRRTVATHASDRHFLLGVALRDRALVILQVDHLGVLVHPERRGVQIVAEHFHAQRRQGLARHGRHLRVAAGRVDQQLLALLLQVHVLQARHQAVVEGDHRLAQRQARHRPAGHVLGAAAVDARRAQRLRRRVFHVAGQFDDAARHRTGCRWEFFEFQFSFLFGSSVTLVYLRSACHAGFVGLVVSVTLVIAGRLRSARAARGTCSGQAARAAGFAPDTTRQTGPSAPRRTGRRHNSPWCQWPSPR